MLVLMTYEGYGLWSFAQYHLGVGVFNCVIQSPHKEPEYLVERIEAFLQSFTENLTTLTDEDWKSNVDALKTVKLQKPLKLSQECSINWPEIANRYYQFDRSNSLSHL
jgi:secreted Zn-dependent insulinase-like peptidase